MVMKRITKAHIISFFVGIVFTIAISAALDWKAHKDAFERGVDKGYKAATK